jgi:integrase
MKRTKHPGIYRRGEKWVAVVSYRDATGRDRQKWLTRRTLKAAQTARRDFLNDLDKGLRPEGGRMTVQAFLEDVWLPEVDAGTAREKSYAPLTVRKYRQVARDHLIPGLGHLQLSEVSRERLRAFYGSLESRALGRYCHTVLSSALGWAVKDRGLLAVNPAASVRPPSVEREEARHLDDRQARRMLKVARGTSVEPAIILGLLGGLRISEVSGLQWGDLGEGSIVVRRSWWGKPKSGKPRGITLPPSAVTSLRKWRTRQAEELLGIGVRQTDETTVLTDAAGRPMSPRMVAGAFESFAAEHGFEVTFHGLRHTSAILMLRGGIDVKTVASRLGHSSPALVLRVYSHFIETADQAAAERLEAVLG